MSEYKKCPLCEDGLMSEVVKHQNVAQVTVYNLKMWECTDCGEELVDMNQLQHNQVEFRKVLS